MSNDQHLVGNTLTQWFVRLYYDGGSDYITVSHQAGTWYAASEKVLPFLQNEPEIRRSLDLKECKAKTSNVSLVLANAQYRGNSLWSELNPLTASRKYLNREAVVWERRNYTSTIERRFTGRIRDIALAGSGEIHILLEPNEPWDFLSIPTVQTEFSGRYFPVVYGLYTPNTSTQSSRSICASRALWPAEVERVGQDYVLALAHKTVLSDAQLHVFEDSTYQFVPVTDSGATLPTSSIDYQSGDALLADANYFQAWIFKPAEYGGSQTVDFSNPENAHDVPLAEDSDTEASVTLTSTNGLGDTGNLYLGLPSLKRPGSQTSTTVKVKVRWTATVVAGSGTPTTDSIVLSTSDSSVSGNSGSLGIGGGEQTHTFTGTMDSSGDLPTYLRVQAVLGVLSAGTSYTVKVDVHDVTFECATELPGGGDTSARQSARKEDWLYCGADGLSKSWTTGACDTIQEIHRDLLIRFAGLSTSTPDGYSDLDTARAGWSGRLWQHKPKELRKILERLQFEGQFVFTWAADGDPMYIFVKSSYSAGDVDFTIIPGIDTEGGIDYSHTPMTELLTSQEIKFEKHPADDRFLNAVTYTNSSARTALNIASAENIEKEELEYLVAEVDTASTGFTRIRDAIYGNIKAQIHCTITRPRGWHVTIGSIIKVEGKSSYYMVTDERRTQRGVSISARAVG